MGMGRQLMDERVLQAINDERDRQDVKWGEQNHTPLVWLAILMEEVGELAQEIIQDYPAGHKIRNEATQVAAVAIAFIECCDRHEDDTV